MFADGLHEGSENFLSVDSGVTVEVWVAVELAFVEELEPVAELRTLLFMSVGGDAVESGV